MEDLNKNQIVLLALLVSFVSSVATSIMTYSLLSEAPPAVTQTVNRVVERTVETVVPAQVRPDVITKEVTVVVKEEDLVIEAIEKNQNSIVRLWGSSAAGVKSFVGLGILLDEDGLLVAPKVAGEEPPVSFEIVLPGAQPALINPAFSSDNLFFFKLDEAMTASLEPAILADSNNLQLGQTIIAIKGEERNTVAIGRTAGLINSTEGEGVSSKFSLIETDLVGSFRGALFINLKGEVIGLGIDKLESFIPANILQEKSRN